MYNKNGTFEIFVIFTELGDVSDIFLDLTIVFHIQTCL
jgi:hypothetical protein